jgi:hypothetical protein
MAGYGALRAAIAARLETIDKVVAYGRPKGSVILPPDGAAMLVLPGTIDFDGTMGRGTDDFIFQILVLVSKADMELAQAKLDSFCDGDGDASVKDVLDADKTLGGISQTVRVARMHGYGEEQWGGTDYLGCRFDVEVSARGSD